MVTASFFDGPLRGQTIDRPTLPPVWHAPVLAPRPFGPAEVDPTAVAMERVEYRLYRDQQGVLRCIIDPERAALVLTMADRFVELTEWFERAAADPSGAPATDDAALTRLLDAYGSHRAASVMAGHGRRKDSMRVAETYLRLAEEARAALLAHLAAHYVRRDRLYDDGPWSPGDGSAYGAALEREGNCDR